LAGAWLLPARCPSPTHPLTHSPTPSSRSRTFQDATAVTPKQRPTTNTTSNNNERVSTLKAIKDQLQDRLASERQAQLDAVKQLEFLGDDHPKTSHLSEQVTTRGQKIQELSQKLTRTDHALGTLQKASNEYEVSAAKVRDVRSRSKASFSHRETKTIRHELDTATAMMSAACQRVEQIESITDTLIAQLSDTESELADLQDLRVADLAKIDELRRKLVDAERRAAEGTPKGKGAKEVLPLALQKLKGAQQELMSVSEEKERAVKDLEYAKQLAAAREDALRSMTSQALQKDEALQNVIKSAHAAANDAADKQEAINALRLEMAHVAEVKAELEAGMADAKLRADDLTKAVAGKQAEIDAARDAVEDLKHKHNAAQAAALEREIVLKTEREEEAARVAAAQEKAASLEKQYAVLLAAKHDLEKSNAAQAASVATMEESIAVHERRAAELSDIISSMQAEGVSSGEKLAQAHRDLESSVEQIKSLNYDLAAVQAAKNEVSGLLDAKEGEIVALTKDFAAKSVDLKATIKARDEKIATLERETAARQALVDNLTSEMDSLVADQTAAEASLKETIASMKAELDVSNAALADLQARHAELEETSQAQLQRAEAELDGLKRQLEESSEAQKTLEASLADEKRARSVDVGRLTEQVEAMERNNASLLRSLEGLEEQLCLKEDEILVAKQQGTPKGEGAKVILQRSFLKIKDMQSTIKDLQAATEAKDREIAELKAENETIPALRMEAAHLQSKVAVLSEQHAVKAADLDASRAQVARLEGELAAATEALASEKTASGAAQSDMAAMIAELKGGVDALSADKAQAELALAESAAAAATLQSRLDESRSVLASLTNKEEGTAKVMKLAFVKVKKLEKDLLLQKEFTETFSSKAKAAGDAHAESLRKLDAMIELHNGTVAKHAEAVGALEANVSRLRGELLDEAAKVESLRADLSAALVENEALRGDREALQNTVDTMENAVDALQSRLAEERDALQRVEAAKESVLAELSDKISEVTKEKEVAESAWGQAAEEAAAATKDLDVARSQLGAYERASNVKESTIASQKQKISELERQAAVLKAGAEDSRKALSQRDAELATLSRGKTRVEEELAESIKVRCRSG